MFRWAGIFLRSGEWAYESYFSNPIRFHGKKLSINLGRFISYKLVDFLFQKINI